MINPTEAAAAERFSSAVGIAQNVGRNALTKAIIVKQKTETESA